MKSGDKMNYDECVKYLLSIPFFGQKAGLNNIRQLLKRLGNPQEYLEFIHVAGTNGKGSVCAMLSCIYVEAHVKVGLFTSPHLIKINERIKINNIDISDDLLVEIVGKVKKNIDNMVKDGYNHPTFFEVLFAISLVIFKQEEVDLAIIEVGLGGRLDSTNIISHPLVSVITPIDYDHIGVLGDTIEAIATEKGGIIKDECPTVLYSEKKTVNDIIESICYEKKSKLYKVLQKNYKISKSTHKSIDFSLNTKYYKYEGLHLNTGALYQIKNFSIVASTLNVLNEKFHVNPEKIYSGIQKFKWPGRMEVLDNGLILDGAHNENSIKAFVDTMNTHYKDKRLNILFTVMKDKAYCDMIRVLSNCKSINKIIITKVNNDRNADVNLIKKAFEEHNVRKVIIEEDLIKAFYSNYKKNDKEILCCVGSLYLIGEVKKLWQEDVND